MKENKSPYKSFGEVLKKIRLSKAKTPAEVAGAVEIDENRLKMYEKGAQRPEEDILNLLIQFFGLEGSQAEELWHLAGYKLESAESKNSSAGGVGIPFPDLDGLKQIVISVVSPENRVVYTDMVQVSANKYGVIMNFLQGGGPNNQPLAVSRIGMSREHAKSVIDVLQKTLDQMDSPVPPKQIGSTNNKDNKTNSK